MGGDEALQLLDQLMWTAVMVAAPILLSALVVGVVISVLQVATQLQEMTLSYIPKLAITALVLIAIGPWMLRRITEFAIHVIQLIPAQS